MRCVAVSVRSCLMTKQSKLAKAEVEVRMVEVKMRVKV